MNMYNTKAMAKQYSEKYDKAINTPGGVQRELILYVLTNDYATAKAVAIMQKIRILHVVQAAGGVDRYIRMLLKYLDKEEFENIMVCSQDFHKGDYKGLADCFEQIEMNRAIGMSDLKSIREVRKQIKKYNPDIIYAHSSKAGAIARMADIGLKNRCVYNPHGWAFNMRCSEKKKMMYAVIEKIAAPFCDKIICISDAEKQSALHKKIYKEEKCRSFLMVWISKRMKMAHMEK